MVRAGCVFVASIHPSRTWTSRSFESLRWNACVHRLDLGLYSHPKEFWGNGVWTHVNSKGKIPSTGKCPQRSIEPATLWQRAQALPTELFRPLKRFKVFIYYDTSQQIQTMVYSETNWSCFNPSQSCHNQFALPACCHHLFQNLHEDGMWLPLWLDSKSHIHKNLNQNGEPQRYSWECRRRRIISKMCKYMHTSSHITFGSCANASKFTHI